MDDLHRIGGGQLDNLRLRPRDATLAAPGISLVRAATAAEAARLFREAFPKAKKLLALAKIVGSINTERIQAAGFDVMSDPSRNLPTHCRLIHRDGVAGFSEENLRKLAAAFVDTREQES